MFKKVYSTKVNVIANFTSSIWTALLSIIFVRFYFNYLTVEAYGLIGFFTTIQTFIFLLDFGLSPSLNRELARLSALEGSEQEMRDIKRTLEIPNWIGAAFIALFLAALAPLIGRFWIQPKNLSVEIVTQALLIAAFNIAVSFFVNFYTGGLMGLRKQFLLSLINIVCGTLRSVGAFFVLAYVSPTVQGFLLWQGLIAVLQAVLVVFTLRRSLPDGFIKGRFRKDLLGKTWRFAAGMTGISIVGLILTQTDKVILSRMLNLEEFGYYNIAITVSTMAIGMVVSSVNHAVYPQFSRLVSLGDENALREFYHRSCQILSVLLFPIMIILALFSYDVVFLWINKPEVAANTYVILSLVAVGNGLNSSLWLPHSMQLAHGWTKLSLYFYSATIVFMIPLMIAAVFRYGAVGGAVVWLVTNVFFLLTLVPIMHRRILKGEQWKWYFEDLAIPFITALFVGGAGKLFFSSGNTRLEIVSRLLIISVLTLFLTALSTKATRNYLMLFKNEAFKFFGRKNQIQQK